MRDRQKLEQELSKLDINELKRIARELGVKNPGRKKAKTLISILLKPEYDVSPYLKKSFREKFHQFWKKYVDGYVRVAVAIAVGLIGIVAVIKNTSIGEYFRKPYFPNNKEYNILILPLKPDRNCKIEDTDYESQIAYYYGHIADSLSLNLNVKVGDIYDTCPTEDAEIQKIGEEENASLVIWGYYDEHCVGETKIRLKYRLIESIGLSMPVSIGNGRMEKIEDLEQLRSGYLLDSHNGIVLKSLSLHYFNQREYENVESIINALEDEDDAEIKLIKLISLGNQGKHKEFLSTMEEINNLIREENTKIDDFVQGVFPLFKDLAKDSIGTLDYQDIKIFRDRFDSKLNNSIVNLEKQGKTFLIYIHYILLYQNQSGHKLQENTLSSISNEVMKQGMLIDVAMRTIDAKNKIDPLQPVDINTDFDIDAMYSDSINQIRIRRKQSK